MGIDARAARNEALYREVNERISELMATFRVADDEIVGFLCECNSGVCQATVSLSLGEYRAVRAHPRHFAVMGTHVDRRIERVVRETDRFAVVEKGGEAGALVEDAA